VFVRTPSSFQLLSTSLNRICYFRFVADSGLDGLVVILHGPDRRNHDDSTRRTVLHRVANEIRLLEATQHQRTIVAGDFNAHPFESAVMAADGLHAIGVQSINRGIDRMVQNSGRVDFFYNPMWRLYGHQNHRDAGAATHHWLGRWNQEYVWHMVDQVVIRPTECVRFPESNLRIVTQVGTASLLTAQQIPESRIGSDHLPIVFEWSL